MALTETAGAALVHSATNTVTTASYTPTASTLQVAVVSVGNGNSVTATSLTVTDTAGGSWTQLVRLAGSSSAPFSDVSVWCKDAGASPSAQTVTVTASPSTVADTCLITRQFAGAQPAASQTGVTATGSGIAAATCTITPGTTGSQVVGSFGWAWSQITMSANAATTIYGQATGSTGGDTECLFKATSLSTASTPVSPGFTNTLTAGDKSAFALAEILPFAGTTHSGTAALSGTGTLTGAGVFAGSATLSGSGTLSATGTHTTSHGHGTAALDGNGTLGGTATGIFVQYAALDGQGTLSGAWTGTLNQAAALDGQGTLQLSGVKLGFTAGLAGNGTLSVLQATGGLVFASPGAGTPYAYPLSSQVMVAPPGTQSWRPLGSAGAVTALTYSFTCPGGADKMTCTVQAPAAYRTQLFNPGWQVKITRGGHQVWSGKLDEPQPSPSGWTLTAVGTGNRGTDFAAVYTSTWPAGEPDQAVNNAISRGLPWINPGVGTPSGAWFGQAPDSASQTVTALLNLICTRGGLTWYVNSQPGGIPGDDLTVFPLPTAVNRLLACTDPVGRTLGGDINTIQIRYQSAADDTTAGTVAAYGTTSVQNAASVTAHGVIETFIDLSSAGVMTQMAAQAVGNNVLGIYQRASFAGPFTARYGQLTNTGGVPVDPGTDQAGTVVKLILTDFGYGGEVTPQFPVTFIVGAFEWDDLAQTATITPYQTANQSLSGLLSLENTELTPITVA